MTEPPGDVISGARFGFQVEAEDPYGNLATGFDGGVTAALAANAGSVALGGPVTATALQGMATFAGLTVDKVGSGYTIQVASDGLAGTATGGFDVEPAAAAQLVVTSQPPAQITAGDPFGFAIAVQDAYGNAATSFSGPITIALGNNATRGTLHGAATEAASGGTAEFSGLTLNTAAAGYTIVAASGSIAGATTDLFTVVPAAAASLVVTVPPPTLMTAGAGFGLDIAAKDAYGNVATGFTGTVTVPLSSNPTRATLTGQLSMAATGGVANYPAFLMLDTAGSGYTLQVSSAGLATITTGHITVVPQPATHLVVLAQPPSSMSPGSSFGIVVAAEDPFGSFDPHIAGLMVVTPEAGSDARLAGTTSVTASQGVATFSGLTLSGASAPVSLQVASGGLTGTTTLPITLLVTNAGAGSGSSSGSGSTSWSSSGGGHANTAAPLVTMQRVQLVLNKRDWVTEILIGLSGGVNASEAQSTSTYRLTRANRLGSFTARDARLIRLRSAAYSSTNDTVTLTPRRRFALTRPVQLQVNGSQASGLEDTLGRLIDGDRDGQPGGDAVAVFPRGVATVSSLIRGPLSIVRRLPTRLPGRS